MSKVLSDPVEILTRLITYPTITPRECGIFAEIRRLLPEFEAIEIEKEGVKNLFLYRRFGEGSHHWCLAGHIDVVPPGEGWSVDPFSGVMRDGYLYGRGAQDMKSGVAAMIAALQRVEHFPGILSLLLTSDEEGQGIYGTPEVLRNLQTLDLLPTSALVTEPTSERQFGDTLKIGRRGSINGYLRLHGKQGHAAYPHQCVNPIEQIASRLEKIAGFVLHEGDSFFEPSRIVVTDIRGGLEVVNVTPGELKLMFNLRNAPQVTLQQLREHLEGVLEGLSYTLELQESCKPFITAKDSLIVRALIHALERVRGETPKLATTGGTSDARCFAELGIDVVECGVVNDRIHAVDERVRVEEVESLTQTIVTMLTGDFLVGVLRQ